MTFIPGIFLEKSLEAFLYPPSVSKIPIIIRSITYLYPNFSTAIVTMLEDWRLFVTLGGKKLIVKLTNKFDI